eukprot:8284074-Lingulodinium_polyedra.AAC.1
MVEDCLVALSEASTWTLFGYADECILDTVRFFAGSVRGRPKGPQIGQASLNPCLAVGLCVNGVLSRPPQKHGEKHGVHWCGGEPNNVCALFGHSVPKLRE